MRRHRLRKEHDEGNCPDSSTIMLTISPSGDFAAEMSSNSWRSSGWIVGENGDNLIKLPNRAPKLFSRTSESVVCRSRFTTETHIVSKYTNLHHPNSHHMSNSRLFIGFPPPKWLVSRHWEQRRLTDNTSIIDFGLYEANGQCCWYGSRRGIINSNRSSRCRLGGIMGPGTHEAKDGCP